MSETALLSMPFAGAVPMTASRVLGLSWYSAPGITQRDGKPAPQIRRTKIMSDNRKYYYLKLKESYFDDDAIVLLESMQDGMLYSNILLKLYLKSLKYGGTLQLDENIPYTAQMIATITRQQVGTVERALQIFMKLGLVEPLDNGALYMSNIELFIGQSSTEGERKRRARMKISEQKRLSGQVSEAKADICPPEIEIKKEIDIEIEKERESEPGRAAPAAYGRYKNVILTDTELSELQAELPDKWEYYIDRLSGYIASTGRKYKNHAATIRRWVADDTAKAAPKQGIPDYSYKEGESL
jgi:predicted phage replisome organizer